MKVTTRRTRATAAWALGTVAGVALLAGCASAATAGTDAAHASKSAKPSAAPVAPTASASASATPTTPSCATPEPVATASASPVARPTAASASAVAVPASGKASAATPVPIPSAWSPSRKFFSAAAVWVTWPLQKMSLRAKDPMSGFFMVRRHCVDRIPFQRSGFKLLLEILVRGRIQSIEEIPFEFGRRYRGASKANVKVAVDYARLLARLYAWKWSFWNRSANL